jgi:hypothetical protein
MSPVSPPVPISPPAFTAAPQRNRRREDLAYQAVTVAAILLVIITAWVF